MGVCVQKVWECECPRCKRAFESAATEPVCPCGNARGIYVGRLRESRKAREEGRENILQPGLYSKTRRWN